MSRVGALFANSLEMLDLSDCDRITAKGLAGLRTLKKLRYLRLEGMDHVKVVIDEVSAFRRKILKEENFCSLSSFGTSHYCYVLEGETCKI